MQLPEKPLADILAVTQLFYDREQLKTVAKNHRLPVPTNTICLIHEGAFTLLRQSDRLLLDKSGGPAIAGIAMGFYPMRFFRIHADGECIYQLVEAEAFFAKIAEHNYHDKMYRILSWYLAILCVREEMMIGRASYPTIKSHIERLWMMEPAIRAQTNLADFIVKRSNLSRSMVMKVLAILRQQHYIDIQRGKLTHLTPLPESL